MSKPSFQIKTLKRAGSDDEYKLYRAALEYGLIEPIVIENREDLRSERIWKDLVKPYRHQVSNLMTFCRRLPVTLLADDVGLGKTVSAGLVASELIARGRINKILIVCPKLLMTQWKEELETKFGITGIDETGRKIFDTEFPEGRFALITTYESARMYLDKIAKIGFDMLILDEAHKLRNLYGTDKAPEVAKRFKKAFEDRLFKYVLMLTATPIQNRLWDIYSLVDLLSVARGHENPFGNANAFARKFIEGDQVSARQLKEDKKDDFRSIVYGYMSRFRRVDADLDFPERKVELYKVEPTDGEKELFHYIREEMEKMSPLVRVSIAQALVSSPQAFSLQLQNMAANETVPVAFAAGVKEIVARIGITAKLNGLATLIEKLRLEKPAHWRVVIFTERRETQSVIEEFLTDRGVTCGLINGTSGANNQEMIGKFRLDPPKIHVIISTRAGSEGVNLQAANVLVNYDLPWNPMIIEQRIGRIQRLASNHSTVCIFNMILRGTFEEHIVGRLMEKLQMATHAVGDVESLLEAAGMGEGKPESLQDIISKLVVASLMGKNIEAATILQEKNIEEAKIQLERDEETINATLGGMNGADQSGPQCPKLPQVERSLDPKTFVILALKSLGGDVLEKSSGQIELALDGENTQISFDQDTTISSTLYVPGSPAFEKLTGRIAKIGKHQINDIDSNPLQIAERIAAEWITNFSGSYTKSQLDDVSRNFKGIALLQVRITVAHDSYERLVEVSCSPKEHNISIGRPGLEPIGEAFQNPSAVGLVPDALVERALLDSGVSEFIRFYTERLAQELVAAGESANRKKKIEDDFTPRVSMSLVGLEGSVQRSLRLKVDYMLGSRNEYTSTISIVPSNGEVFKTPSMEKCAKSEMTVPVECLDVCQISGQRVMRHLLSRSETSGRPALPEHVVTCALTGKRVLSDEVEKSDVSEKFVLKNMLEVSALSGKRAEPNFFIECAFSLTKVLESESSISQISEKKYRIDQQLCSVVSGKLGHQKEFILCSETSQAILPEEAEKCEITGKIVRPGILLTCNATGKKAMPAELDESDVSHKMVLKAVLEVSALSGKRAEPKFFSNCEFSSTKILQSELAVSEISEKKYRIDQQLRSVVSGKTGHQKEFVVCIETNQAILPSEAEKCDITGKVVKPGILQRCDISGKMVMPTELEKSAVTGKMALKKFFVSSSLSSVKLLEDEAIRSITGKFCMPAEARACTWSGRKTHPDDLRICQLTSVQIHVEYAAEGEMTCLQPLILLLNGIQRMTDMQEIWPDVFKKASAAINNNRFKIEAAQVSPDRQCLAICSEVKTILGIKTRHVGLLISPKDRSIVGRIVSGKRESSNWKYEAHY